MEEEGWEEQRWEEEERWKEERWEEEVERWEEGPALAGHHTWKSVYSAREKVP